MLNKNEQRYQRYRWFVYLWPEIGHCYPKLVNVLYNTIFGCLSKMVAQFAYVIYSLFLQWIIQSLLLLASAIYYALAIQLL